MKFPTPQAYGEALQAPKLSVLDGTLKGGTVQTDALGLPFGRTGSFAITFKVAAKGKNFAYRCFLQDRATMQERYDRISAWLESVHLPFFVEFAYINAGVQVEGKQFPTVRMEWADGVPLGLYMQDHHADSGRMTALQQQIQGMAFVLHSAGIAHGDIQGGNVLVGSGGEIKLVDYDGMFVPTINDLGAIETGHPNFQHPQRSAEKPFDVNVDNFSFAVLHTVLSGLIEDPTLWNSLDGDADRFLLGEADFADPFGSPAFAALTALPSTGRYARSLQAISASPYVDVPVFTDFLNSRNIPTVEAPAIRKATSTQSPANDQQPWYQQDPITASASNLSANEGQESKTKSAASATVSQTNTDAITQLDGSGSKPTQSMPTAATNKPAPQQTKSRSTPAAVQKESMSVPAAVGLVGGILVGIGVLAVVLVAIFSAGTGEDSRSSEAALDDSSRQVGDCFTGGGARLPVECDSADAAYRVEKMVSNSSECEPEHAYFTEKSTGFCATRISGEEAAELLRTGDCVDAQTEEVDCANPKAVSQITAVVANGLECPAGSERVEGASQLPLGFAAACLEPIVDYETCIRLGEANGLSLDDRYGSDGLLFRGDCFEGLGWEYEDGQCWYFPPGEDPVLQQFKKKSGRWETVKKNITEDLWCSRERAEYPRDLAFVRKASTPGVKDYRVLFADGSWFEIIVTVTEEPRS